MIGYSTTYLLHEYMNEKARICCLQCFKKHLIASGNLYIIFPTWKTDDDGVRCIWWDRSTSSRAWNYRHFDEGGLRLIVY